MGASLVLLALAAALAAAVVAILAENRRERARRRDVLADCAGLLDDAVAGLAPSGYGVLRGRLDGRPAALTPIGEALAFRRLPQLWIAASLRAGSIDGSLEVLRRPTGADFYAGGDDLPLTLAPPPALPKDARLKADRGGVALALRLEGLLGEALSDPKIKAVGVGPRGVRVVRQAAQGAPGAYRLFRDARFPTARVAREDALAALDLARRIAAALETVTEEAPDAARAA